MKVRGPEWIREKLSEWKGVGIKVDALEKLITSGAQINHVLERVEEFEKEVRALRMLREALMDLDTAGFGPDVDIIMEKLNDVERISDIEVAILKLQFKIERRKKTDLMRAEQERREREGFGRKLMEWRQKGFNVRSLEDVMQSSDLHEIDLAFHTYERFLTETEGYLRQLDDLGGEGEDDEIESIQVLLRDPSGLVEAEERLLRLKLSIDRKKRSMVMENEVRRDLKQRLARVLERWEADGFNVDALREQLDRDPDVARVEIERVRLDVDRLAILKEELGAVRNEGIEEQVSEIAAKMRDIDRLGEIEEDILGLQLLVERKRQEERRRQIREEAFKEQVREKIAAWRAVGHDISVIQAALEGDFIDLRNIVQSYEERLSTVKMLNEELDSLMSIDGVDTSRIEEFRGRMGPDEDLKVVEDDIIALRISLEKERRESQRRKEITQVISRWESQGYDVSNLYRSLNEDNLRNLERALVSFRIGVHTIKELRSELDLLDRKRPDLELRIVGIRSKLNNVARIPEAEKELFELKQELEEAEDRERDLTLKELKARTEIAERITGVGPADIQVDMMQKLEAVLNRERGIEEARDKARDWEDQLERADKLVKRLESVDTAGFEAAVEEIRLRIKNLEDLDGVEVTIDDLLGRIARKRDEEQRKRQEESRKRTSFKDQLEKWREEGFDVSRLEGSLDQDIATIRGQFIVYRIRIQRLKEIMKEVQGLSDDQFWEDKAAILAVINDADRISEVETRYAKLRKRMADVEEERLKRAEYLQKLEEWGAQGYDVARLRTNLHKDLETVSKDFLVFKIRLQKLEDLREELNVLALSAQEHSEVVAEIRGMLKDVDRITEIRAAITALKARIEDRKQSEVQRTKNEAELREELLAQLSEWAIEGYDVEELIPLFDGGMDLRTAFRVFEEMVERKEILEKRLEYLDTKGFEGEVALIRSKLLSVERIREAEEDVAVLEEAIRKRELAGRKKAEEIQRICTEIEMTLGEWEREGYNITPVKRHLGGDFDELNKEFVVLRIRIERLKELERNLKRMDVSGFEERRNDLLGKLKDIENIGRLESDIADLVSEVRRWRADEQRQRREEKLEREAYAEKMMDWISHGYSVRPLEDIIEKDIRTIRRSFNAFERAIDELKAYENLLDNLEERGYAKQIIELRSQIMNVESLPSIRESLTSLRERLGEEVVPLLGIEITKAIDLGVHDGPTPETEEETEVGGTVEEAAPADIGALQPAAPGPPHGDLDFLELSNLRKLVGSLKLREDIHGVEGTETLREGPLGPGDGGTREEPEKKRVEVAREEPEKKRVEVAREEPGMDRVPIKKKLKKVKKLERGAEGKKKKKKKLRSD